MISEKLKQVIRDVPDFPKQGIIFKDITPVLTHAGLCNEVLDSFIKNLSFKPDAIVGIESRGFLFGFALALRLNIPFIMVRKAGKLPYKKHSFEYTLEYGSAIIEMHEDALQPGWKVLIHDDLLATGGTAAAAASLIKMQQAEVAGFAFVIELPFLNGRELLKHHSPNVLSLVSY
jgi:adenine phosphoribosyltransferase